jgi:hypothetical protein
MKQEDMLGRFEAAEIEEAGRRLVQSAEDARAQSEWAPGKSAKCADPKLAVVVRALAVSLLLGWVDIHAKHPNHRSETAGQKCARRDEQLLQLLLRMHILATLANPTGLLLRLLQRHHTSVQSLMVTTGELAMG